MCYIRQKIYNQAIFVQFMLKIFLVRHGETNHNKNKIIQGQLDTVLSAKGRLQAKALSEYFKNIKFDAIYSSDLKRARHTCKVALSKNKSLDKTKIIYDERLKERHAGAYQGRSGKDMHKAIVKSGKTHIDFKPKGGESMLDLYVRSKNFLDEIIKKHKNGNILIVSHGGVITSMLLYVAKDSHDNYRKYHPNNAAISIISVKNKAKIHTLNYVKHLS